MLTLLFLLTAQATAVPPTVTPVPAAKMRCRREVEIGYLAQVRKVCHTKEEWDIIYRNGRATAAGMQQPSSSAPPKG